MTVALLVLVLIFAIALPVGLLIWWKKKSGVGLLPFAAGALCFFLFAMVLEQISHYIFLVAENPLSRAVNGSTLLYALYGALAAGIFEETARRFGFKVLLKKYEGRKTSIAYGIGHGGMEVILVLGVTCLMYLLSALGVSFGDAATDALMAQTVGSITPGIALLAMFERLSALALHVGLSVFGFAAVHEKGKGWLFPLSILLHAADDLPAALCQRGVLSAPVVEVWAALIGFGVLFAAIRLYRKLEK